MIQEAFDYGVHLSVHKQNPWHQDPIYIKPDLTHLYFVWQEPPTVLVCHFIIDDTENDFHSTQRFEQIEQIESIQSFY